MVKVKSPICLRDLEGRFGISFKALIGKGLKSELFDTNKMVTIDLKKGECIALLDSNDNFWELCRNEKGRYNMKKLDDKAQL